MPTDLEAAWDDLHDAKPPGWYVGRPSYDDRQRVWQQYAFDPRERAQAGAPIAGVDGGRADRLEVIRELARCLLPIREGRVPE